LRRYPGRPSLNRTRFRRAPSRSSYRFHPAAQRISIALAKATPNSLNFASGGNGSTHHLCAELLKTSAAIEMVRVPYKGPAPALHRCDCGTGTAHVRQLLAKWRKVVEASGAKVD